MTEKQETGLIPDSPNVKDDTLKSTEDESILNQDQETQVSETPNRRKESKTGRGPTAFQDGSPKPPTSDPPQNEDDSTNNRT